MYICRLNQLWENTRPLCLKSVFCTPCFLGVIDKFIERILRYLSEFSRDVNITRNAGPQHSSNFANEICMHLFVQPTRGNILLYLIICDNHDLVPMLMYMKYSRPVIIVISFNVNLAELNFPPVTFYDYSCADWNLIHALLLTVD